MEFKEHMDKNWLVVDLVPGFLVCATNIQFGEPTIINTRVPTVTAMGAWINKEFTDYSITKQQAFAAYCFEAGVEYQRNRKLRKRISESCSEAWQKINKKEERRQALINRGAGI